MAQRLTIINRWVIFFGLDLFQRFSDDGVTYWLFLTSEGDSTRREDPLDAQKQARISFRDPQVDSASIPAAISNYVSLSVFGEFQETFFLC